MKKVWRLENNPDQVKVWHDIEQKYEAECLILTFKSGQQSIMAWRCFIGEIKESLVFCDEYKEKKKEITAKIYLKILGANLWPF